MKFKTGDKVTDNRTFKEGPYTVAAQHPLWDDVIIAVDSYGTPHCLSEPHLALYREPIKVAGWVNVYPKWLAPCVHDSKEEADAEATKDRIACVYVTGTEGEKP